MSWIKQNESPVGYEPVWTVIEKETGREIATSLEEDEALIIENSLEIFESLQKSRSIIDKYYMNDRESDKKELRQINETLTKIEMLLSRCGGL